MKRILYALILLGIICSTLAYFALFSVQVNSMEKGDHLYITSDEKVEDFYSKLLPYQSKLSQLTLPVVAQLMRFGDQSLKAGRYNWTRPMSNVELIRYIRSGNQKPINVVVFNGESIEDLAGIAGKYLEKDSVEFLKYLDDYASSNNESYNQDNFLSLFIPNTYEMYWNCDPECFVDRMKREHNKFWTDEKLSSINKNNLSTKDAYILASIVEKESKANEEKKTIAGVYLNRLKRGMLLQADPTVVFASGEKGLRRVLNKHLAIDSPYNTYMYPGLPPGPIAMPSLSSLEAVINPEDHDYLYFCAKIGYDGQHEFAKTLEAHNRNALVYRNWLNRERIY